MCVSLPGETKARAHTNENFSFVQLQFLMHMHYYSPASVWPTTHNCNATHHTGFFNSSFKTNEWLNGWNMAVRNMQHLYQTYVHIMWQKDNAPLIKTYIIALCDRSRPKVPPH